MSKFKIENGDSNNTKLSWNDLIETYKLTVNAFLLANGLLRSIILTNKDIISVNKNIEEMINGVIAEMNELKDDIYETMKGHTKYFVDKEVIIEYTNKVLKNSLTREDEEYLASHPEIKSYIDSIVENLKTNDIKELTEDMLSGFIFGFPIFMYGDIDINQEITTTDDVKDDDNISRYMTISMLYAEITNKINSLVQNTLPVIKGKIETKRLENQQGGENNGEK